MRSLLTYTILLSLAASFASAQNVSTTEELISAVRDGAEGRKIQIGPGIFELPGPLELKTGMTTKHGNGGNYHPPPLIGSHRLRLCPKEIRPMRRIPKPTSFACGKAVNITISNLTLWSAITRGDSESAIKEWQFIISVSKMFSIRESAVTL